MNVMYITKASAIIKVRKRKLKVRHKMVRSRINPSLSMLPRILFKYV